MIRLSTGFECRYRGNANLPEYRYRATTDELQNNEIYHKKRNTSMMSSVIYWVGFAAIFAIGFKKSFWRRFSGDPDNDMSVYFTQKAFLGLAIGLWSLLFYVMGYW